MSFGPETEKIIDTLGLPDTLHTIYTSIARASLLKQLVLVWNMLKRLWRLCSWMLAMHNDFITLSPFPYKYDSGFTWARNFNVRSKGKKSAWSAWVHFKGIKFNTGNSEQVRHARMSDIIKAEYSELIEDKKKALVTDFDKVKSHAIKWLPNITACLEALSQCAGMEAFIFMVCGTSTFQMAPKAFVTSAASMVTNYKDCVSEAKLSIRAGFALGDVTKDALATVEFMRYKIGIVCKYHITAEEVEEHRHEIADGAVMTPETEPSLPPPPSTLLSFLPSESAPSPLSTLADSDPNLLPLSRDTQNTAANDGPPLTTNTQNTATNDGPPLTTSQLPPSKVHHKQVDANENAPQPQTKHARKLTEKQAALEDARASSKQQRKQT
ncbi:hypothetical protein BDR07DRAFT_1371596 [Suillus spraguei]|nr:hypothetical protein BDR07DRAFT_1371596 [Suillus spraguei]